MGILQLISSRNFITVNKDLIKALGLEEAILIGELASESDYWEKQGKLEEEFFFSTVENIEENTTLSEFKQRKALKNLKQLELIEIKKKGIPAKRYIKINEEKLFNLFNGKFLKNYGTGALKITELNPEKLSINNNIINNNINNNKINKKEKKETEFDFLINDNFTDKELKQTIYEFIKMRKAIKKPLTTHGLELIINKLKKLSNNSKEQIKILDNSIMNNWQGIFPLKPDEKEKEEVKYYIDERTEEEYYASIQNRRQ